MPKTQPRVDRVSLRPGTLELLRKARTQVAKAYELERTPSYTGLIVAGLRGLLLQAGQLKRRPFDSEERLAMWVELSGGIDLPEHVCKSMGQEEVKRLLALK